MPVVLAVTAVLVSRLLVESTEAPSYGLLVAAVAIAVWYGGFVAGLLAVFVGFALSPLAHTGGLGFEEYDDVRWAVSFVAGALVVWVGLVMRRGQERAATAAVAAEESTRQMGDLQQLTTALLAAVTPSDVARELIRRTPGLLGARGGALGLIEREDLVIVDSGDVATQTHRPGLRLPLATRAPITRAAAEGELKRADDRRMLESEFPDGAALTPYAQAALSVPLHIADEVVGSMSYLFDRRGALDDDSEAIALIAADLGGQALERAALYERERQSRRALDRILRVAPRFHAGTPEEVATAICREARATFSADVSVLWRVEGSQLRLVAHEPVLEPLRAGLVAALEDFPGLLDAVGNLEATFVADVQAEARGDGLDRARRLGIHSSLRTPIVIEGHAELVLIVSWASVIAEPDAATMAVGRRFADQAGLALGQLERRQAEEESALRAQETRRLLDTTAALASAATPSEVTSAILHEGLESLGAVAGVVAYRPEAGEELEVIDSQGYRPETVGLWQRIPIDAAVPLAEAVRENRLIAIASSDELEARYPEMAAGRGESTGAWISLPLSAGGSIIGVAGFSFAHARRFSQPELEFAEALARQSGQALERALLLAAEYSARTRAEDMVVLTSALSQAVSPAEVVNAIGTQIMSHTHLDIAGIYLVNEGASLDLVDVTGRELGAGEAGLQRLPLDGASLPAEAARSREAVWLETYEDWNAYDDGELWKAAGARDVGAVPLVVDHSLLGILFVGSAEAAIGTEARELVEFVARQAAQPLERAWLMQREQTARLTAERASARTRRLQSVTQALSGAATPQNVAAIVVQEALAAMGGDAAALLAFDRNRDAPELLAQSGLDTATLAEGLTGPIVEAALSASLLVVDGATTGVHAHSMLEALAETGLSTAASVPLSIGDQVLGSLFVGFQSDHQIADEDTELLLTLARIGAQALERSRLFEEELRLRRRSERIQTMTASLSGSLTQRDVAEVVVDALVHAAGADGAALSVVTEERGVQKKLASRGYDDVAQDPWLEIPLDVPTPGTRAITDSATVFYDSLEALGRDFPETVARMRNTDHESFLFVPLVISGSPNGLLITSWAARVVLSDEDRLFIETLASQAAQALDRARHFDSERTIAETLQQSVLPASLPRIENVQLAARYLPGTEGVDVGGDWFDAIQLANGRLGLAVGDVVGKGIQAAATMAQIRNALRVLALDQMKPSSTIARLDRLTDDMSDSAFATVVYAVVDHEARVCRFTCAGHPPPLVVFPDGHAEYLEGGRGLPLGTGSETSYRQQAVELPVGSIVVLYTDGLVERRGEPIDEGLERLRQAVEEAPGEPERLVEHVLERLVGDAGRGDDIALLAVRLLAVAPRPLELRLPSLPRSLDLVRDALRVWLQPTPVTQSEAHEIVLATWEACANAIEHPAGADGRAFVVRAELERSSVAITVKDSGSWLPERERPDRGLGLRLIRSMMSSVDIDVTPEGTFLRLEKELASDDIASLRRSK